MVTYYTNIKTLADKKKRADPTCLLVARCVSFKKQKLLALRENLVSSPTFWYVRVAHLFSFMCFTLFFVVLCTVPNVCVSALFIHDFVPRFSLTFTYTHIRQQFTRNTDIELTYDVPISDNRSTVTLNTKYNRGQVWCSKELTH